MTKLTSLRFTFDEFTNLLKSIYGDNTEIELSLDGIDIIVGDDYPPRDELHEKLAEKLNLKKVDFLHADKRPLMYEPSDIWVTYSD